MKLAIDQVEAIQDARSEKNLTVRPTVPELEALLYSAIPVLDHGFVRVIDYMGDDSSVVQAARVSYGRGTRRISEDRGLIRYLMRNNHTTPFEMAEIKLHVKLPIFVARQWVRHRTASINEYSARYSILDKEFYIPSEQQIASQSTTNRQGRERVFDQVQAQAVMNMLREEAERNYQSYAWLINESGPDVGGDPARPSLARELARIGLSLNTYTQWYWKTDLHNLLNFLRLRADAHAQYEIRAYAEAILEIVKAWTPITYEAFQDYRLGSFTLSRMGLEALRRKIAGEVVTAENSGLSAREWAELNNALHLTSQ